jgi:toxin HigB-1
VIRSFRDRRLKRLYERGDRSRIAPEMVDKVENILFVLDRAPADRVC